MTKRLLCQSDILTLKANSNIRVTLSTESINVVQISGSFHCYPQHYRELGVITPGGFYKNEKNWSSGCART